MKALRARHLLAPARPIRPYICTTCRHRTLITSTAPPPPPPRGFTHLSSRRLISLLGPDASKFLQGVLTKNILSPSSSQPTGFPAAFLNAQGRVLHDVFVYYMQGQEGVVGMGGEGWLIEVDANEAERLQKHLKRYKLRAKLEVRLLEVGERGVWSLWDEGSRGDGKGWTENSLSFASTSTSAQTASSTKQAKDAIEIADQRAPGMGRRLILPGDTKPLLGNGAEGEECDEGVYKVRRYLKGIPEGQSEILREHALPQESNLDYMGAIDYRKGCYVGQELTIRTHHTGVVRKRILPLMVYGEGEDMPKTLEYRPDAARDLGELPESGVNIGKKGRGRSAGKWLSGVGNLGLGLCRLEMMVGEKAQEEEFVVEWGGEGEGGGEKMSVKVKAFVPSWHLSR